MTRGHSRCPADLVAVTCSGQLRMSRRIQQEQGECRLLLSCGYLPALTLCDRDFISVFNLGYRKRGLMLLLLQYNMRKTRYTKTRRDEGGNFTILTLIKMKLQSSLKITTLLTLIYTRKLNLIHNATDHLDG